MKGDADGRRARRWGGIRRAPPPAARHPRLATCGVLLVACGALLAGCGSGGDAPADGGRRFVSVGTAGTGGIYYPLGGTLANLLTETDPARTYTAEVTGGSRENVRRIRRGQMQLGLAITTTLYRAYTGEEEGAEAFTQLRIVAPLYPNLTHVLVPGDSEARSVADFRGRRISVGSPGSGTEQMARQLLQAYGLTYDDLEPRFLSFAESASALADGAIDGAILSVGYPAAAVLQATSTGDARLLPVDSAGLAALRAAYPYFRPGRIPPGVYPGVERAVPTAAEMNWIVARADLDGEIVRLLLDVLEGRREALERAAEIARQIDLAALRDAPIPLHPAAEEWLDARSDGR